MNGVRRLLRGIDALWILNDDRLLTAVDLAQARALFSLREDALRQVDRMLDQD